MKRCFIVLILMVFVLTVAGCEKEGTAEKAGKTFDKMLDSAKDKVNEATK
ncbi:hypothetical protein SAMN05660420_03083 [Desulfuromusa kysingii]|uniref:Uncharacterized protein n=1 Tax=Desulfuromusa kysingii TaxID=37625 RepID=A0A1H4DRW3_9BACT|nr:hypothetical protein [Desulfuromusa kysingii]SEA75494.1 hypothetical protein SAMN05660420_03083 [Desulfuromusa kysingii]